jgi:SAM-dependent methyltransferase
MRLRPEDIHDFYENCYSAGPQGENSGRWRELGAVIKANHVAKLIERSGIDAPDVVVELGCGDGAVLAELGRRKIGGTRVGLDISSSGIRMASNRPEVAQARVFDGRHIIAADGEYDLAIATHVLEHVPQPDLLLREMLRVARAAIVEVPLERNLSARRPAARVASEAAGHLHRFTARRIRAMIADAGWRVEGEIFDPLPPAIHAYGRGTRFGKAKGYAKWAVRATLAASPALGQRMITLHYAAIALPAPRRVSRPQ